MKKTLALLLALFLLAATFVACEKEPVNNVPDDDEDDGYINTDPDENENPGNNEQNPNENEQNPNENEQNPSTSGWVTKNDVVYAGVQLRLRTSPSSASNNNIAKTVNMGTKMNRSEVNAKWSKVTLDGETTEYYVSNAWLASASGDFTFTNVAEPVSLTVNASDYSICFFYTPFESDDEDAYFENVLCAGGFKLKDVSSTYTLKKVAASASGNWIKVEFVGTVTISGKANTYTEAAPGVFYVKTRAISRGDITDPTYSTGNENVPGHG